MSTAEENLTGILVAAIIKYEPPQISCAPSKMETGTWLSDATFSLPNPAAHVQIVFQDEKLINKRDIKHMAERYNPEREKCRLSAPAIVWICVLSPYPNVLVRSLFSNLHEAHRVNLTQTLSKHGEYNLDQPESDDDVIFIKFGILELLHVSDNDQTMGYVQHVTSAISIDGSFIASKYSPEVIATFATSEHLEQCYPIEMPVSPWYFRFLI